MNQAKKPNIVMTPAGVSFVICSYNGAKRLPETLKHLAKQEVSDSIPWEVVLVDNASTDDTTAVARRVWQETKATAPLRVLEEARPGKSFALDTGYTAAQYELLVTVDDDNWVCPEWVQLCRDLMAAKPDFAVYGGPCVAAFEAKPPDWFEEFQSSFAVGPQWPESGEVTGEIYFRGAGVVVRKSAYEQLKNAGFEHLLVCRKGASLSSGGDSELCMALTLIGWRSWYDERLTLQHYMPAQRLQWSYLRRLHRGFGAARVSLRPYWERLEPSHYPPQRGIRAARSWQVTAQIKGIMQQHWRDLWRFRHACEGDSRIIALEEKLGALSELARGGRSGRRPLQWLRQIAPRTKTEAGDDAGHHPGSRSVLRRKPQDLD